MRTGRKDPNRPTAGRRIEVQDERPVIEDAEPSTTASTVPATSVAEGDAAAALPTTTTRSARA